MQNYLNLLQHIKSHGVDREGRNGKTRGLFAQQLRWDLSEGFPAVTTKKLFFGPVVGELLWFISGSSNDNDLRFIMRYPADKPTIWTANAESPYWKPKAFRPGDLGRIYGVQWRRWGTECIDQLQQVIEKIKRDPNDRRLVVSAWNPSDLDKMALPPCHMLFQFSVYNKRLHCSMVQRSCDMFLGVPFNIASYALLTHMVAQVTGLQAGELSILFQDAHIYHEHFEAVDEQIAREPRPLPTLYLNPSVKDIDDFCFADAMLRDYNPCPSIPAKMIV